MPGTRGSCSTTRRRRDEPGGIRHAPGPPQRTLPLVGGGGDPERLYGLAPSTTTASQPRSRAGVVMRRAEARCLGGAHACREGVAAEGVTTRSVAEEPAMVATRESENGSLSHDGLVMLAGGGGRGREWRAPTAPLGSLLTTGQHPQVHRRPKAGRRTCHSEILEASAERRAYSPGRAKGAAIVVGCLDRGCLDRRGCRAGGWAEHACIRMPHSSVWKATAGARERRRARQTARSKAADTVREMRNVRNRSEFTSGLSS